MWIQKTVDFVKRSVIRDTMIFALAPIAGRWCSELPRRRVIAFHDIPKQQEKNFTSKIRWLLSFCNVVSLADLYENVNLDAQRLNVALTFDDGYKDCISFVAPMLATYKLPATFFIPSGAIGRTGEEAHRFTQLGLRRSGQLEFLNEDDIGSLASNSLFEIGGHSADHVDLGVESSMEYFERQIFADKERLEALIKQHIRWFAFPFGQYANVSQGALDVIRRAGYSAAFTIVPSFWEARQYPYLVGRDSLSVWHSDVFWGAWLRGGYDLFSKVKKWKARKALSLALGNQ